MRFGAKGLMSTLMRVRISSDAPRCTVQFGALDPRCTMVQVHGDPNEPSLGAGAAGAPCVTLAPGRVRAATPLEPGDAALPQPSLARPRPLLPRPHAARVVAKVGRPTPNPRPVPLPQTRCIRAKARGA